MSDTTKSNIIVEHIPHMLIALAILLAIFGGYCVGASTTKVECKLESYAEKLDMQSKWQKDAIKNGVAHYDAKTGAFTWNTVK